MTDRVTASEGAVRVPLTEEDREILALECATVVGHTCHVVVLGPDPVGAEAVRMRIGERLGAAPELHYRLGGTAERPEWEPVEVVDLSAHVVEPVAEPLDEAGLRVLVADRFAEHLDRTRPLWAIDVVRLAGGGTALVWRVHHALADGTTVVRLLRTVLCDVEQDAAGPARPPAPSRSAIAADHARRRAHLAGFVRREFAVQTHRSPFAGPIGTRRTVAFADTSLPELHDAARSVGGTLNDAVLAVLGGALRRWLEHHGGAMRELRVRVPVSLHHEGADVLNRDSYFSLALPLHVADPVERLRTVHRETTARKDGRDAERMDVLVHELPTVSASLRRLVAAVQASSREFAVCVSNVPGPREPVSVLGRPVRSVRPVAEIGTRHALRVCAMSSTDSLAFGMCADPTIVEDVDRLMGGLDDEVALLIAAAARSSGAGA